MPKRDHVDGVEREALQHVLQVKDDASVTVYGPPKQREQPASDLVADDVDDEPPQRAAAELVASVLALPEPLLAVGVEEAAAEEV